MTLPDASTLQFLDAELTWLDAAINTKNTDEAKSQNSPQMPAIAAFDCPYANFIKQHHLGPTERLVLALAMAVEIRPRILDYFQQKNTITQLRVSSYGGRYDEDLHLFQPTFLTAAFLIDEDPLSALAKVHALYQEDAVLRKYQILRHEEAPDGIPQHNTVIALTKDGYDLLLFGEIRLPKYSADFPAKRLTTRLDWEHLILAPGTAREINYFKNFVAAEAMIRQDDILSRHIKSGYRMLFYGPPGSGKTLTVSLIGKMLGREVFRVDLSQLVSKYIGETEKNLGKLFERARQKNWILFFDEADALFGKRTDVTDAHDRYANQSTAYLLQEIEDFDGLIILASNLKDNIDRAFLRRLQAIIYFPMPGAEERYQIWQQLLPDSLPLEYDVDLREMARKYVMDGGSIVNIVQHLVLLAAAGKEKCLTKRMLLEAIQRELNKTGRTL